MFIVLLFVAQCYGKEIRITPHSDIEPIAKSLEAGDSVVLSDGQWQGVKGGSLNQPAPSRR